MPHRRHGTATHRPPKRNASRHLLAAMAELYAPHIERSADELLAAREQLAREAELRGRRQCELHLQVKGRG